MFRNYALNLLERMLKIYSPPGKEQRLAEFLRERMANDLGFSNVNVDKVNNVWGEVGSGRPKILLCGHTDTVPGRQPVKVTRELIYGRGAADAKSALASMILAASSLTDSNSGGKIVVVGVSDEEGNGLGTKELVKRGLDVDYAIFGEPSGIDNITIGYKGRVALKVMCKTASVHASAPWMAENAVERVMEVWDAMRKYALEREDANNRYRSISTCLTQIKGGSAHNVTPGECEITVDVRVPPPLTCSFVLGEVEGIIRAFQNDVSFPKIETEVLDVTEPFETQKTSPLIRALTLAILSVRKKRPMLLRKTGTGDMNILGLALKIPLVTYGPGNPHLSHTLKEHIEASEYLSSIEVYKQAILNLWARTGSSQSDQRTDSFLNPTTEIHS